MTIQFEKLKTRLLANPKVKAEYDALAPEFEIAAELLRALARRPASRTGCPDGHQPISIARLESGQTRRAPSAHAVPGPATRYVRLAA